jgi:RHS repeat-associated protein
VKLKLVVGLVTVFALSFAGSSIPAPARAAAIVRSSARSMLSADDPEQDPVQISGRVQDSSDPNGVSDTWVRLLTADGTNVQTQTTDDNGYYYFSADPGTYTVQFQNIYSQSYAMQWWQGAATFAAATFFTLTSGQVKDGVNSFLQPGASISGNVKGLLHGHTTNLQYIGVEATGADGSYGYASTDASGNYSMTALTPDVYSLHFETGVLTAAYDSQWYSNKIDLQTADTVTVSSPTQNVTGINQVLQQGGTISGKLTDSSGKGIQGTVEVYATGSSDDDATDSAVASVIPAWWGDGSYSISNLPVGSYKVGFTHAMQASSAIVRAAPSAAAKKLNALRVSSAADYSGGPTTDDGGLAPSFPYLSQWYSSANAYATATPVTIATPGQTVSGVNGKLILDPAFNGQWPGESIDGKNPAEKPCQCSHADPVNTATGEYFDNATDLSLGGVGPAVAIGRSYSSASAATDGPFGFGWSASFSARVQNLDDDPDDSQPSSVQVVQENGSTVRFTLVNGQYMAPPRVMASLQYDWGSNGWIFTRQGSQVMTFDSDGKLVTESDPNGNTVNFGYDESGDLTSITGSGDRALSLTWDSGHIASVGDSAGRPVSYSYYGSGNLTGVTGVDSAVTSYGYGDDHYLTTTTKPGGGITTNVYDGSHRVTSQTDAIGRETRFSYDTSVPGETTTTTTAPDGAKTVEDYEDGILASSTVAAGTTYAATTAYTYDDADNVSVKTDPLGLQTAYTYNDAGNELSSYDPQHHTTSWTYNSYNEITSSTNAIGQTSTTQYDYSGNMTMTRSPSGRTNRWTRNSDGTAATFVDGNGQTTTYSYDGVGHLASTTDANGRTTATTYNSAGFVTSTTKPGGKLTTYTVDPAGRILTMINPDHGLTSYAYNADGNVTGVTDPNRHVTHRAYDLADQVTSSSDAYGKKTLYTYTGAGQLATQTDPDGNRTKYTYNAAGEKIYSTDADGNRTAYHFDLDGRNTAIYLPSGAFSTIRYDKASRKIGTTDANGNTTTYAYDAAGEMTSVTDPLGRTTATAYDGDGEVATVTLPDGSTENYGYDYDGNTVQFFNADGKETDYAFTAANLMSSKTEPGELTTSYTYNPAGLLYVQTNPDGATLTYSYNGDSKTTRVASSISGSTDTVYHYGESDQRTSMTDTSGTTAYTYDRNGLLISTKDGAGKTVAYSYDAAGRQTSMTYPGSKTVHYSYDAAGRMTSLTDWNNKTTTFGWSVNGQLSSQADPNGVAESRHYDADGQTTDIADAASGPNLAEYSYSYDAAGELTSIGTSDPSTTATNTRTYAYDANNQLTTVTQAGNSSAYAATSAGELTATADGGALAYNDAQELTGNTPTSAPATSFTYDGNGSRTNSTTAADGTTPAVSTSYTYDPQGNLAGVTLPGTSPASVAYISDGDGLRQSRTTGSTTTNFVWDVSGGLPLLIDDGTHSYLYGPSSAPLAQIDDSSGVTQYLHGDNIGSTRLITDASGTVVATIEYDPYGILAGHTGTAASQIGYSGNWTDPDSGLVYLRARDYDPSTGQFLTVDPAVDTTGQPYAYVANDPLTLTDPTGLCVGMDGTPQDRQCTQNDFFWAGLGPSLEHQWQVDSAGFNDGLLFGAPLLINNDQCEYGNDPSFWAEYALGVAVSAASLGVAAADRAVTMPPEEEESESFASREWASEKLLLRHYKDHGADFGATSAADYAAKANQFFREAETGAYEIKVGADGTVRVMDPATNTFGSFSSDGTIKTFFKPTSPTYWDRQ